MLLCEYVLKFVALGIGYDFFSSPEAIAITERGVILYQMEGMEGHHDFKQTFST